MGTFLLVQTSVANAATNWTPYLKSMLSGCEFGNPTKKLPAVYKSSIATKKVKGNPNIEDGGVYMTYTLKNSTAFGLPLLKIEYLQGYEWNYLKLYFKDAKFTTLRPQFKLPKINKDEAKVVKNDKSGYEVENGGYLSLVFDQKQKSITCGAGV